jgi:hypothetical protein
MDGGRPAHRAFFFANNQGCQAVEQATAIALGHTSIGRQFPNPPACLRGTC